MQDKVKCTNIDLTKERKLLSLEYISKCPHLPGSKFKSFGMSSMLEKAAIAHCSCWCTKGTLFLRRFKLYISGDCGRRRFKNILSRFFCSDSLILSFFYGDVSTATCNFPFFFHSFVDASAGRDLLIVKLGGDVEREGVAPHCFRHNGYKSRMHQV